MICNAELGSDYFFEELLSSVFCLPSTLERMLSTSNAVTSTTQQKLTSKRSALGPATHWHLFFKPDSCLYSSTGSGSQEETALLHNKKGKCE